MCGVDASVPQGIGARSSRTARERWIPRKLAAGKTLGMPGQAKLGLSRGGVNALRYSAALQASP